MWLNSAGLAVFLHCSEIRSPKTEIRNKSELRTTVHDCFHNDLLNRDTPAQSETIRISGLFRASDVGFRISSGRFAAGTLAKRRDAEHRTT
jgi:hypothetical protein